MDLWNTFYGACMENLLLHVQPGEASYQPGRVLTLDLTVVLIVGYAKQSSCLVSTFS